MYLKPLDSDTTQMAFFSWKICNFDIIWIILFFCSKIFVFLNLSDIQSKISQMIMFSVFAFC